MALILSLCCFGCSAINDLVFKFFARKERSRGLFVAMVGITGVILMSFLPDKFSGNISATVFWGLVCGFFSAFGNILLIESMSSLSAGVCSTIYRLNLALVVPFSVLFFGEKLYFSQGLGVFFAIMAVAAFLPGSNRNAALSGKKYTVLLPMVMIITASVFRAGLGIAGKYGALAGASPNGITFITEVMWIIAGLGYWLIREKTYHLDRKVIEYGAASGVLVSGILFFMIRALACEGVKASVVLPVMQMSFLLTFLLSVIFLKEKFTLWKLTAMICGTAALLLLC